MVLISILLWSMLADFTQKKGQALPLNELTAISSTYLEARVHFGIFPWPAPSNFPNQDDKLCPFIS